MNVSFISNRPGQAGVSSLALLYAATVANEGMEVLYIPVAEDNRDVMYWVNLLNRKDITVSIVQLYQMLQGGAITPQEIKRVSRNIDEHLSVVDMTDTSLTKEKYSDLMKHILSKNNQTTKSSAKTLFDLVVYDIHRDTRTNYVLDSILTNSNAVVNVTSQNYIVNELDKETYLYDIKQEGKCITVSNKFTEYSIATTFINSIVAPQIETIIRIAYDNQIVKDQNKGDFRRYIKSMVTIPTVKQQQIYSSLSALNRVIYKKVAN